MKTFDNYEIHPCKRYEAPDSPGQSFIEQCEPADADVWTLYGHIDGEGVQAIGDFATREHAEEVFQRITRQSREGVMSNTLEGGFYCEAALQLAYEAGRWQGQVDLEEHYDMEQYSQVFPEVFASRKTSSPGDLASTGRTVRINLRSEQWREGVRRSVREYLDKARAANRPGRGEGGMTPSPEGYTYGFVQVSRAWYAKSSSLTDKSSEEIMIGLYADGGGCRWEFGIRWHLLREPSPRVEVFHDAWCAFAEVPELFAALAKIDKLTPQECCDLLATCGFVDQTPVERTA